jgi:hypothetical protein
MHFIGVEAVPSTGAASFFLTLQLLFRIIAKS